MPGTECAEPIYRPSRAAGAGARLRLSSSSRRSIRSASAGCWSCSPQPRHRTRPFSRPACSRSVRRQTRWCRSPSGGRGRGRSAPPPPPPPPPRLSSSMVCPGRPPGPPKHGVLADGHEQVRARGPPVRDAGRRGGDAPPPPRPPPTPKKHPRTAKPRAEGRDHPHPPPRARGGRRGRPPTPPPRAWGPAPPPTHNNKAKQQNKKKKIKKLGFSWGRYDYEETLPEALPKRCFMTSSKDRSEGSTAPPERRR